MATVIQLDAMLTRNSAVCGGRLCIDGTRVTVQQIVALYKRGESAEEIASNFPQLTLGQVYTALAYYHANQSDVERELAAELTEFDRLQQQYAPPASQP